MKITLAHGRTQLPFTRSNITVTNNGTTTISRTMYFSIQGQNYLGLNFNSAMVRVDIGVGQSVAIAPPTLLPAEKWVNFIVSATLQDDSTTLVQIGKIPVFTLGSQINTQPLILSADDHFALSSLVSATSALPLSTLPGMMRGVSSENAVYEYDLYNGWKKTSRLFNTYIADITKNQGCAQDARYLTEFNPPTYSDDGSKGTAISFWMVNDTNSNEPSGKRLGMVVKLNEEIKTNYFDKKLWMVFRGYVNTATNTIRNQDSQGNYFNYIDQEIPFDANKATFVLQDVLMPGEAFAIDVYPRFNLNLVSGTQVKVYPFFYEEAGEYSEAGEIIGDVIYNSGDRCLVVPGIALSVRVLTGGGMIDSFSFQAKDEASVIGLKPNKENQIIAINGNGYCRLTSDILPLDQTEGIRAIVSTLDGISSPSNWSEQFYYKNNETIQITCNYPVREDGFATIRLDYPDTKIAGLRKANFNPTNVILYIKRLSDNKICAFKLNAIVPGISQTFLITSWASGELIAKLPTPSQLNFGLFSPTSSVLSIGVGFSDTTSGYYQSAFAFEYKNVVTSISHDEASGCILTLNTNFSTTLQRSAYWAEPVVSKDLLKKINTSSLTPGQQRSVLFPPDVFRFDAASFAPDSDLTLRPIDISSSSPGRWIAVRDPKKPFIELTQQNVSPLCEASNDAILYLSSLSELLFKLVLANQDTYTLPLIEKTQIFKQGQAVEPATASSFYGSLNISMLDSNRFVTIMTEDTELYVYDRIPGYAFELKIEQASYGDVKLSFPNYCKFVNGIKPFISPEPGKVDILSCVCFEEGILYCALAKDFS